MRRLDRLVPLAFVAALFVSVDAPSSAARAQKKPGALDDTTGRLPAEGSEKLDKQYRDKSKEFRDLAKGEPKATKAHAELIDLGAKYHVYRLTWRELNKNHEKPGSTHQLISQLELVINDALRANQDKQKAADFMHMFGRQLNLRLKEVLSHDDPTVRLNAALVLPALAKLGHPETADLLAEILRDDRQTEAVRYWTLPALKELFAQTRQAPPLRLKPDQEERCIVALNEYLSRPPDFPERIVRLQQAAADEKTRDTVLEEEKKEVAQYEAGLQFARRAAVRALAETRYPAALKKEGGRQVPDEKGLTALSLVRVAAHDIRSLVSTDAKKSKGLPPRASLGEQVEAAIGICQLQSALTPEYFPDYAAQHVGRFLVEFATRSNTERGEKKEPWRNYAGRLLAALGDWQADMKKRPAKDPGVKYVNDMIGQATGFLKAVEAGADANAAALGDWLRTPPPNKSLYKGMDKAVVKSADTDAQ